MLNILGASALTISLVEGWGVATALVVKVFSGTLSDDLSRRKGLAVFGYTLGALTKPLFALAAGVGLMLTARLLDSVGKSIRGAPRDAMVANLTPPAQRGAAFGLCQSLDTMGGFLGPLLAVGLMLLWANDFRAVFWVAAVPGLLAVLLLSWGMKEPVRPTGEKRANPVTRTNLTHLGAAYWRGWCWVPCSRWPDSAKPSWCGAHNNQGCRW